MDENKIKTQIAILGGGPAGYVAAVRAKQLGADVLIIEEKELGGVCLNVGCIPTKALLKTSEIVSEFKKAKEFGVESSIQAVNWNVAVDRKNKVSKNLNSGLLHLMSSKGIEIVSGKGEVIDKNNIVVTDKNGDIKTVTCDKIILATGAAPVVPKIEGVDLDGVVTSNELLDMTEIPKSMVIIGAGVIGLEFATMFNSVGVKITVIEFLDKILPNEDEEISGELLKLMKRKGITFKLSGKVEKIHKSGDILNVEYSLGDKNHTVECEKVLVAVGRRINTNGLEKLGLNIERGGVVVNEHMETNIPGVYACGDLIGGKLLAHLSFMEGKSAAENAMGISSKVNYDAIPACVYTNPEIASVGMTESEAQKAGIQTKVGRFSFRNNGRALTLGEREGFVKIVVNNDNTIIGAQILGANASEMISELTLAIILSAKAETLADMIHPHPSLSEAIWEACSDAIGRSLHK